MIKSGLKMNPKCIALINLPSPLLQPFVWWQRGCFVEHVSLTHRICPKSDQDKEQKVSDRLLSVNETNPGPIPSVKK